MSSSTFIAVPKYLFRYMPDDDRLLEMLTAPYLWFSDPLSLNDPFDLTNVLEFDGDPAEILEYMSKYGRLPLEELPKLKESIERGDTSFTEVAREVLKSVHTLYLQRIGVCCCSFRNDVPLMWAHYAAGHSGACLVINASSLVENYSLIQVQYATSLPKWNLVTNRLRYGGSIQYNKNFDQIVLGTKYRDWSYEQEFRLISPTRGKNNIERRCVAGIVFGARMDQKRRDQITKTVSSVVPDLRMVTAELDHGTGSVSVPFFQNEKRLGRVSGWCFLTDPAGEHRPANEDYLDRYLTSRMTSLSDLPYPSDEFGVGSRLTVRIYSRATVEHRGNRIAEFEAAITNGGLQLPNNFSMFNINPATGDYLKTVDVSLYLVAPDGTEHYAFSLEIRAGKPHPLIGF